MSHRRTARRSAKARREDAGIDVDVILTEAEQAVLLSKVLAPSTKAGNDRALAEFRTFIEENYLGGGRRGEALYEAWAGDLTLDELFDSGRAPALNVNVVHAFLKWKIPGMLGKIDPSGRPTIDSVEGFFYSFWDGWKTVSRIKAAYAVHVSAIAYINTTLKDEFNLKDIHREIIVPDKKVLMDILGVLFHPDLTYHASIARVYFMWTLNVQVASASRIGAVLKSHEATYRADPKYNARAICWKDVQIILIRDRFGGHNHVEIRFRLRFTKTESGRDREYRMFEGPNAAFNGPMALLVIGVAEGCFEGNPSLEQLLDPAAIPKPDDPVAFVRVKDSWMEQPVCRMIAERPQPYPIEGENSKTGSLADFLIDMNAFGAWTYNELIKSLCHIAGYPITFASHDLRRLAAQSAMSIKSNRVVDVQYGMGHSLLIENWTRYMANKNFLNFQECILGEGSAEDKLGKLSSMRLERAEGLPFYLGEKDRNAILEDEALVAIEQEQRALQDELDIKYGSWQESPEADKVQSLYNDWRQEYYLLYRKRLKSVALAFAREKNSANFSDAAKSVDDQLSSLQIEKQIDAIPQASSSDYSISATSAAMYGVDFDRADTIFRLAAGSGDPAYILSQFCAATSNEISVKSGPSTLNEALSGPSTTSSAPRAAPRQTGPGISRTPSQVLMPPPNLVDSSGPDVRNTPTTFLASSTPTPPAGTSDKVKVPRYERQFKSVQQDRLDALPLLVARGRSRSTSVSTTGGSDDSSTASTSVSDSQSTGASPVIQPMSILDLHGDVAPVNLFDKISSLILDPDADKLEVFTDMLSLPAQTSTSFGWWLCMSMVKISGADSCPRCHITLDKFIVDNGFTKLGKPNQLSRFKRHIFNCFKSHVHEVSVPLLLDSFDQSQPCPLCISKRKRILDARGKGDHTDEVELAIEEDQDDDDDDEKQPHDGFLSARVRESNQRKYLGPKQWNRHIDLHSTGEVCECGYVLQADSQARHMHFISHHNIFVTQSSSLPYAAKLSPEHFREPHFSLQDNCWHMDPRDWERCCQQEFDDSLHGLKILGLGETWDCRQIVGSLDTRSHYLAASTELAALEPITLSSAARHLDARFFMVITDSDGGVVARFGHCFYCVFNEDLSWTDRLTQFTNIAKLRRHIVDRHLLGMYAADHPELVPSMKNEDGTPAEPLAAPLLYRCPDPSCQFSYVDMMAYQLNNHVYLHHGAFEAPKLSPKLAIAANDAGFRSNITDICVMEGSAARLEAHGIPKPPPKRKVKRQKAGSSAGKATSSEGKKRRGKPGVKAAEAAT